MSTHNSRLALVFFQTLFLLAVESSAAGSRSRVSFQRPQKSRQTIAQNTKLSSATGASSIAIPAVPVDPAKGAFSADLGFELQTYGGEVPGRPELNKSALLSTNFKYESGKTDWGGKVDGMFGRYLDLNYSIFAVRELFYSYRKGTARSFGVALGRKDEFWSEVDQNWDLGLWEPRYLEEPLRPMDQGITGLIGNFRDEGSTFEWSGYVSPIFIPTMEPALAARNGDLVSDSRWKRPPANSTVLMSRTTKLVYNLEIPAITKLISNPGYGTRFSLGRTRSVGPWASASFARKPINSLQIKYDYKLAISADEGDAAVNVGPAVSMHRLWGADAGWNFRDVRVSLSYLEDAPETQLSEDERGSDGQARTEWIQQVPMPVQAYGAHLGWQLPGILAEPLDVKFDYLKANTTPTHDYNSSGVDKGGFLPHRLMFTNALQLRLKMMTYIGAKPFQLSTRMMRELDQKGNIYSLEARYFPMKAFAVHGGFDILGPDEGGDANKDDRFLNLYRTNDRLFGGVSYVF